jgi:antitoxin MazE
MYIQQRIYIMDIQVARWGNSLALRIPAEIVRRLGLREGSTVQAQISVDGSLSLRPAHWDRKAFAQELGEARDAMPAGGSVLAELRSGARY